VKRTSQFLLSTALLGVVAVALMTVPVSAAEISAPDCTGEPALDLGAVQSEAVDLVAGEPCGGVICPPKMECCNPTCNKCVFPGMRCTQQVCNSTSTTLDLEPVFEPVFEPIGPIEPELCGNVVCPKGTTCCNPLCSACTPPGVSCTLGDCGGGPTS